MVLHTKGNRKILMKNKEKYDLRKLDVTVRSSVDNCGRKIEPKHIMIMYDNELVHETRTYGSMLDSIFEWLESWAHDGE